ncbi:MAG: sensor histidine kinase [Planctomycetota bacterium]
MKTLWHVWTAFLVCLAIGVIGMTWLTVRAIELERAEAEARRAAARARQRNELQERIATALWRMDWMLTPLIAQEATRPSFIYRPFLESPVGGSGKSVQSTVASPLLTQPDHVRLNFEVSADNAWRSPQIPSKANVSDAVAAGVSPQVLSENRRKLEELSGSVSFKQLLNVLPDTLLPTSGREDAGWGAVANNLAVLNDGGQQADGQRGPSGGRQAVTSPVDGPATGERGNAEPPRRPQTGPQTGRQQQIASQSQTSKQSGDSPNQRRARQEWQRRNLGMQNVARSQRAQMMSNSLLIPDSKLEQEGPSRPIWIDSKLLLARRVASGGDVRVQGCWLDWPQIKARLKTEVADLFSEVALFPVKSDETVPSGRLLATLPVQLVVPNAADRPALDVGTGFRNVSAMHISLVAAWCCLLIASIAVAIMLHGVLALSERRASFVSAVTHELRSPLTTFRMYAEMLSEGMVQSEQQRDRYLLTLRQEADRLTHLVENVLQYARLERGRRSRRRLEMELKTLLQQSTERLPQRARAAGMELDEIVAPGDAKVTVLTDPAAVEQILFNLVDNSCKYASHSEDRRIHLHGSIGNGVARIQVTDHGPGIRGSRAKRLFLPFRKSDQEAAQSAPGIGLGLALCRRLATEIGGNLHFTPGEGEGATFLLELPLATPRGK